MSADATIPVSRFPMTQVENFERQRTIKAQALQPSDSPPY